MLTLRCVVQRASAAEVVIAGRSQGRMAAGIVVLFAVGGKEEQGREDVGPVVEKCVDKLLGLRIFSDAEGKLNLSVRDVGGGVYAISQFTLFGDCAKGFRPGFSGAAPPAVAERVYDSFVAALRVKAEAAGIAVHTGEFAADMSVSLVNDGPVTILLDFS